MVGKGRKQEERRRPRGKEGGCLVSRERRPARAADRLTAGAPLSVFSEIVPSSEFDQAGSDGAHPTWQGDVGS